MARGEDTCDQNPYTRETNFRDMRYRDMVVNIESP